MDQDNNQIPQGIECPNSGYTRPLDHGVICWAIKALVNSGPGRKFRLRFHVVYMTQGSQEKMLYEEQLYSEEFGVYSNKNNRANKFPSLGTYIAN